MSMSSRATWNTKQRRPVETSLRSTALKPKPRSRHSAVKSAQSANGKAMAASRPQPHGGLRSAPPAAPSPAPSRRRRRPPVCSRRPPARGPGARWTCSSPRRPSRRAPQRCASRRAAAPAAPPPRLRAERPRQPRPSAEPPRPRPPALSAPLSPGSVAAAPAAQSFWLGHPWQAAARPAWALLVPGQSARGRESCSTSPADGREYHSAPDPHGTASLTLRPRPLCHLGHGAALRHFRRARGALRTCAHCRGGHTRRRRWGALQGAPGTGRGGQTGGAPGRSVIYEAMYHFSTVTPLVHFAAVLSIRGNRGCKTETPKDPSWASSVLSKGQPLLLGAMWQRGAEPWHLRHLLWGKVKHRRE